MKWLAGLAFLSGTLLPLQVGVNATLKEHLGHAMQAALASFFVGTGAALLYCLIARVPIPKLSVISGTPWWAWVGGLFGAFYIWVSIVAGPKIGAAALLALVVAGQMVASLLMDHYALLGMPHNPMTAWRVLGVGLVIAGVTVTALASK
jgi:bacterial/archaeal transporter family-2 protein